SSGGCGWRVRARGRGAARGALAPELSVDPASASRDDERARAGTPALLEPDQTGRVVRRGSKVVFQIACLAESLQRARDQEVVGAKRPAGLDRDGEPVHGHALVKKMEAPRHRLL